MHSRHLKLLAAATLTAWSLTAGLAQANTRSPAWVKPSKRWPRVTSSRPSSSSRLRRRIDRVGWVMLQRAAAWPKWRVCSSAIRNLSCLISMKAPAWK